MPLAVVYCLGISTLYVASFYVWPGLPASRQHPATVKARMLTTLLTSCVAWMPALHMHHKLSQSLGAAANSHVQTTQGAQQPFQQGAPTLLQLLGIDSQLQHLVPAVAKGASLTLLLFLGPLYHKATTASQQDSMHGSKRLSLHMVRDYVWSPIAEEWCFRACMVPLMWMQGYHWRTLVFVTPLFFGMCHLHHCWSVLQTYGFLPRAAAAQTVLQLLYTTVFGWYATWLFLATGSILAAVVVHSICNVMGLPPFWRMGGYSIACSILGVALFWPTALRVLHPPPDHALWWWQNCVTTHPAFATRG